MRTVTLQRRENKPVNFKNRKSGLLFLSFFLLITQPALADSGLFLQIGVGQVFGSQSPDELSNVLTQKGVTINQLSQDDSRSGWHLNVGYDLSDNFSLQLGYVDLGEVEIALSAEVSEPTEFIDFASEIHPNSAVGYTVGAAFHYPINQTISFLARIGILSWDGEFDSVLTDLNQNVASNDISGTDLFFGFGGAYRLTEKAALSIEWEHYKLDDEESDFISLNLSHHF